MSMTDREQEVFDEMLVRAVVRWYGAPPHADAPAIAMVWCAIAAAETLGHLTAED